MPDNPEKTKHRDVVEALRREVTLFQTLMENLPDPIYFKDTASRFLRVNRAVAKALGLSDPAQVIGKSDADFFTEAVVRMVGADFARIWMIAPGDRCADGCLHAKVTEGPHVCRFRERCLHLLASSGRYTHTDGDHGRVPFGCYKIGKIASGEDSKFLTNDATNDPRVHNHEWAKELGLVSFAGYRLAMIEQCARISVEDPREAPTCRRCLLAGATPSVLRRRRLRARA